MARFASWQPLVLHGWRRLTPNALPGPICALMWVFTALLVWQLFRLEQFGLATVAALLSLVPQVPVTKTCGPASTSARDESAAVADDKLLSSLDPRRVITWWQCGQLMVLKLQGSSSVLTPLTLWPSRSTSCAVWITPAHEEPARHLLRELRLLARERH